MMFRLRHVCAHFFCVDHLWCSRSAPCSDPTPRPYTWHSHVAAIQAMRRVLSHVCLVSASCLDLSMPAAWPLSVVSYLRSYLCVIILSYLCIIILSYLCIIILSYLCVIILSYLCVIILSYLCVIILSYLCVITADIRVASREPFVHAD